MRVWLILGILAFATSACAQTEPVAAGPSSLETCRQLVTANGDGDAMVKACEQAVEDERGGPRKDKLLAFEYASTALRKNNQKKHALAYAEKAIVAAEKAHATAGETAAAYLVRAQAREALLDVIGAEQDAGVAETQQRTAWQGADARQKPLDAEALKSTLRYHAKLLKELQRDGDAIARNDEAAKL